jgi:glutamate formiminotransferase
VLNIRTFTIEPSTSAVPMGLIESVPNVSDGRTPEIAGAIAASVAQDGVVLLDCSADPSHNRSVFTIASESAESLQAAILRLVDIAVTRIDLRTHRGAHPRLGAVDVVPFIPLDGTTMRECVDLSRRVGRAIADAYGIPVYLYEESASRPERRRLEQIRKGQFEGLAGKMAAPEWAPDFGPRVAHPTAGATVVGARMPLIAFNVDLATDRVDVARAIARSVRESTGGLPAVKALGLWLSHRGIAQVSMNLTDYVRTPIEVAFDAVVREARARGVRVLESELIGLIPAAALRDLAPERIGLSRFSPDQVLESRLRQRRSVRL